MIWRGLEKRLDDETILSITQCYLLTPEEYEEVGAVAENSAMRSARLPHARWSLEVRADDNDLGDPVHELVFLARPL